MTCISLLLNNNTHEHTNKMNKTNIFILFSVMFGVFIIKQKKTIVKTSSLEQKKKKLWEKTEYFKILNVMYIQSVFVGWQEAQKIWKNFAVTRRAVGKKDYNNNTNKNRAVEGKNTTQMVRLSVESEMTGWRKKVCPAEKKANECVRKWTR